MHEQSFSYRIVEAALAKVFGATPETVPVIRAKINNFQRIGLTPASPGRGKVIRYSLDDVYDWGLALSLSEFGMPPRIINKAVKLGTFSEFLRKINENTDETRHLFLMYYPSLFYDSVSDESVMMTFDTEWAGPRGFRFKLNEVGRRYALIDLSRLKQDIDKALKSV